MGLAGSSVAAMVVGTVFIMIFGMATVSLVDSVDQSISNADYKLPDPEVTLVSVTDKEESTGPVEGLSTATPGSGYTGGDVCGVTGASGTGLQFIIAVGGSGEVTGVTITASGSGYAEATTWDLDCPSGGSSAQVTIDDIHDQNKITIRNTGSENVDLSHISITFSDSVSETQGKTFSFTNHYTGPNLFLFPGEEISTGEFSLDPFVHGYAIVDDPDRAFLSIYDHNSVVSITIT